jgi:hypothetical protein
VEGLRGKKIELASWNGKEGKGADRKREAWHRGRDGNGIEDWNGLVSGIGQE